MYSSKKALRTHAKTIGIRGYSKMDIHKLAQKCHEKDGTKSIWLENKREVTSKEQSKIALDKAWSLKRDESNNYDLKKCFDIGWKFARDTTVVVK